MKKNLLISLFLLFSVTLFSQQNLMLEVFTQASCDPCAGSNEAIDELAAQNQDKLVVIKYHMDFPGFDPMYLINTSENLYRKSYYGIWKVPEEILNGEDINVITQEIIDQEYPKEPTFAINLFHEVDKDNDIIYTTAIVEVLKTAYLQAPKLLLAVVEDLLVFDEAPGENGETEFKDVFIKFLPTQVGSTIPNDVEKGDYFIFNYSWNYSKFKIYDEDQLSTRAFIQDNNKKIYQAAKGENRAAGSDDMLFNNDVEVLAINGIPAKTCSNKFSPTITIRNNGKNAVNSALIKYRFNNETEYEYTWQGTLNTLETVDITLDEISMNLQQGSNTFKVDVKQVNGENDSYTKNNKLNYNFSRSLNTKDLVKVIVRPDNAPQETTWEIKNSAGNVIASGGPYTTPNNVVTEEVAITEADCYTFTVYDEGGNGVCCDNGTGLVQLESNTGEVILVATEFGSSQTVQFSGNDFLSVEDLTFTESIEIFPNPTDGLVYLNVNTNNSSNILVDVYSVTGVKMFSNKYNVSKGENIINLDLSNLPLGLYIVKTQQNGNMQSSKLIIK